MSRTRDRIFINPKEGTKKRETKSSDLPGAVMITLVDQVAPAH